MNYVEGINYLIIWFIFVMMLRIVSNFFDFVFINLSFCFIVVVVEFLKIGIIIYELFGIGIFYCV